jgi:subtilisin family serine protease
MKWISFLFYLPILAQALPIKEGERFRLHLYNEYVVYGDFDKSTTKVLRKIAPEIHLVESNDKNFTTASNVYPNYTYFGNYLENATNDAKISEQFHLKQIDVFKAWQYTQGDSDLIVAVTDNEFAIDHDDLKNQWWTNPGEIPGNGIDDDNNGYIDDVYGWDFIGNDNDVSQENSPTHGTHVAGIIAAEANNKIGVAGIAPNVKIMPLRWYGDEGRWTSAVVAETYYYAVNHGAKIINTSYNIDGLVDDVVYLNAVKYVTQKGAIIFNSAGNDGKKDPPRQKVKDLILVCSVTSKKDRTADKKSSFSNYGSGIHLCAPGDPILSTVVRRTAQGESRYGELQGTSMASPVAAAVAALIWSHNREFNREQVIQKLLKTTDNIEDKNRRYKGQLGTGRVNAFKAVR